MTSELLGLQGPCGSGPVATRHNRALTLMKLGRWQEAYVDLHLVIEQLERTKADSEWLARAYYDKGCCLLTAPEGMLHKVSFEKKGENP